MGRVYDFAAYKILHLLDDLSVQVDKRRCEMIDCQECLRDVAEKFENNILSLRRIDEELAEHQQSCEYVLTLTDECTRFIETEDIDELVGYRNKIMEAKKNRAKE